MFTVHNFAYLGFYDHILCGISQLNTALTVTESLPFFCNFHFISRFKNISLFAFLLDFPFFMDCVRFFSLSLDSICWCLVSLAFGRIARRMTFLALLLASLIAIFLQSFVFPDCIPIGEMVLFFRRNRCGCFFLRSICNWESELNCGFCAQTDYNRKSIFLSICSSVVMVFFLSSVVGFLVAVLRAYKLARINFNDINCGFMLPIEFSFWLLNLLILRQFSEWWCKILIILKFFLFPQLLPPSPPPPPLPMLMPIVLQTDDAHTPTFWNDSSNNGIFFSRIKYTIQTQWKFLN